MAVTWENFERYRQKGLDARRAGEWDSARIYLLEAARAILQLSKDAQGEALKQARREMSQKLLDLARDCENAKGEHRNPRFAAGPQGRVSSPDRESEGNPKADSWIV